MQHFATRFLQWNYDTQLTLVVVSCKKECSNAISKNMNYNRYSTVYIGFNALCAAFFMSCVSKTKTFKCVKKEVCCSSNLRGSICYFMKSTKLMTSGLLWAKHFFFFLFLWLKLNKKSMCLYYSHKHCSFKCKT